MQRILNDSELFISGDPSTNTKGTILTADWLNAVQEELAQAVEGLGGVLDPEDNTQLLDRLIASFAGLSDFSRLLSANGYQRLPGGLILQWGTVEPISSTADTTITLPIAFPNNFYNAQLTQRYTAGSGSIGYAAVYTSGLTQMIARCSNTQNYNFFAIGR